VLIRLNMIATRVVCKGGVCHLVALFASRHPLSSKCWHHCENQTPCRRPLTVLSVGTIHITKSILIVGHHTLSLAIPLVRIIKMPQASRTMN